MHTIYKVDLLSFRIIPCNMNISMDSVFNNLDDTARAGFLRSMMGSFGCSYICLRSYLPTTCLIFKDGCYRDQEQASSSGGGPTLASRLFDQYCHQPVLFLLHQNDLIPGLAFQHNLPYMEINDMDLLRMASSDVQRQFYQEARIKTTVFLGCNSGEIELGFSILNPQINTEMEMRSLFPEDFSRRQQPAAEAGDQIPRPADPNPHNSSSSCSSFRSLSTESPEYSSLVFNINPSATVTTSYPMSADPIQEAAIQALARFRSPRMPTLESEHAQMTRAILAVLSSSPPEASSSQQTQNQNNNNNNVLRYPRNPNFTAFEKYSCSASPARGRIGVARTASMFKRSVSYFRGLNVARMSQIMHSPQGQGHNRPSATQIHHVMSERRRREKLNDSFQALRSLLPPGSKKDKASVLSSTREYLSSLRAQVAELSARNRELEAARTRLDAEESATCHDDGDVCPNGERVHVRIRQVSEGTTSSEVGLVAELVVSVRGGEGSVVDLVIRILEFIKRVNNVSLVSVEANHRLTGSTAINRVVLRLKIQGSEWDESGFQEAVKRVVSD